MEAQRELVTQEDYSFAQSIEHTSDHGCQHWPTASDPRLTDTRPLVRRTQRWRPNAQIFKSETLNRVAMSIGSPICFK